MIENRPTGTGRKEGENSKAFCYVTVSSASQIPQEQRDVYGLTAAADSDVLYTTTLLVQRGRHARLLNFAWSVRRLFPSQGGTHTVLLATQLGYHNIVSGRIIEFSVPKYVQFISLSSCNTGTAESTSKVVLCDPCFLCLFLARAKKYGVPDQMSATVFCAGALVTTGKKRQRQ